MYFKINTNVLLFALSAIAPDQDRQSLLTKDTSSASHGSLVSEQTTSANTDNEDTRPMDVRPSGTLAQSISAQRFLSNRRGAMTPKILDNDTSGEDTSNTRAHSSTPCPVLNQPVKNKSQSQSPRKSMRGHSNRLEDSDSPAMTHDIYCASKESADIELTPSGSQVKDFSNTGITFIKPALKGGRDSDRGITISPEPLDPLAPTSAPRIGKRGATQLDLGESELLQAANQGSVDTAVVTTLTKTESFSDLRRHTIRNPTTEGRDARVAAEEHNQNQIVTRVTEASKIHTSFQVCCKGAFTIIGAGATLFAGWKAHQNKEAIIYALNDDGVVGTSQKPRYVIYAEKLIHQEIRDILNQNATDRAKLQLISDFAEILSNKTLTVAEVAQNMLDEARYIAQETNKLAASQTADGHLSQTVIA